MKLLCAQVLKDLLGEGIDVRVIINRVILYYSLQLQHLNSLIFFLLFFSSTKLQNLLQMQSLVSCPYTRWTSLNC